MPARHRCWKRYYKLGRQFSTFENSDRHRDSKPEINIHFSDPSNGNCRVTITNKGRGSFPDYKIYNHDDVAISVKVPRLESVTSRRHWSISGNLSNYGAQTLPTLEIEITKSMKPRHNNSDSSHTFRMLGNLREDKGKKQKLDEMLKDLIPGFTDWDIDTQSGNDYLKYITSKGEHRADLLGDGTLSLFRICLHLVDDNPNESSVLVIDEPELSLHPVAQAGLARLIAMSSASKQVVVCTHSTYFVNWSDYQNGANL